MGSSDGGIFSLLVTQAVRSRLAASCVTSIAQLSAYSTKNTKRGAWDFASVCARKMVILAVAVFAIRLKASGNISYVSSILEWLRKLVLATRLDEGRGDFALDILRDH